MLGLNKIYKHFYSTIYTVFYLYKLYKYKKNQFLDPSELRKLQVEKLKILLHHAYSKVGYYKKLFDRVGIKPEDIKNINDIAKIPITTKKELQALSKEEITAKDIDINRCFNLRTSGSTGMPLDIFVNPREIMFRWLFYRRIYFENGGKLSDKELRVTTPQNFIRPKQWFRSPYILDHKCISIFDDIESQLKVILEFKPEIICSPASALKDLAIEIEKKKIKDINPIIIFTTAELMTKQDKEFISSIFKAELFDYYSCNECGAIAWECREHFGYHINSENVIVEFIKDDGTHAKAGEEGEIVITSLNYYTMPFIRYRLGDIGIPSDEKCTCGRTLPLIKKIIGRSNDYFVLPNGRKIHPFSLTCEIEDIPGISQYQMIQQKKDKVRINIVKDGNFSHKTLFEIQESCKGILGNDVEIEISIAEEIPNSRRGKFQAIKSELQ